MKIDKYEAASDQARSWYMIDMVDGYDGYLLVLGYKHVEVCGPRDAEGLTKLDRKIIQKLTKVPDVYYVDSLRDGMYLVSIDRCCPSPDGEDKFLSNEEIFQSVEDAIGKFPF
jgi:hypothetical protein